ncbi:MAG TPA: hypothetical protein VGK10_14170, partial [Prolixibacteraceae bacterium]
MDKRKLVNIIIKDLEEIKALTEEVAESEDDSSLIIDLALNRARLLCQEIGLLRELAGNSTFTEEETYQVSYDSEEEESAVGHFPDPELEILNFEDRDFSDSEELPLEDELEEEEEEEELEENLEEDLEEEEEDLEENLEEDEDEISEEDLDEADLSPEEENEEEVEEVEEEKVTAEEPKEEPKEEIHRPETKIQSTELKNGPQPGV